MCACVLQAAYLEQAEVEGLGKTEYSVCMRGRDRDNPNDMIFMEEQPVYEVYRVRLPFNRWGAPCTPCSPGHARHAVLGPLCVLVPWQWGTHGARAGPLGCSDVLFFIIYPCSVCYILYTHIYVCSDHMLMPCSPKEVLRAGKQRHGCASAGRGRQSAVGCGLKQL